MKYETLLKIAKDRRSIRAFTEQSVSREVIEKIVEVGRQAPSGFNSQPWQIYVVDDLALRDEITSFLTKGIGEGKTSKGFAGAPVFMFVYGDTRIRETAPPHMKDNDAWWEFTFNTSLSNTFMCMQLAAASLDLGTMWVSAFKNPTVDAKTKALLGIPPQMTVFEMMAIGYPAVQPEEKTLRKMAEILQFNKA